MAFSLQTHKPRAAKGQPRAVEPYLRLSREGQIVFLQNGEIWSEGGQRIADDDLPEWFDEELAKCNIEVLHEVGFATDDELDKFYAKKKADQRSAAKTAPSVRNARIDAAMARRTQLSKEDSRLKDEINQGRSRSGEEAANRAEANRPSGNQRSSGGVRNSFKASGSKAGKSDDKD